GPPVIGVALYELSEPAPFIANIVLLVLATALCFASTRLRLGPPDLPDRDETPSPETPPASQPGPEGGRQRRLFRARHPSQTVRHGNCPHRETHRRSRAERPNLGADLGPARLGSLESGGDLGRGDHRLWRLPRPDRGHRGSARTTRRGAGRGMAALRPTGLDREAGPLVPLDALLRDRGA